MTRETVDLIKHALDRRGPYGLPSWGLDQEAKDAEKQIEKLKKDLEGVQAYLVTVNDRRAALLADLKIIERLAFAEPDVTFVLPAPPKEAFDAPAKAASETPRA